MITIILTLSIALTSFMPVAATQSGSEAALIHELKHDLSSATGNLISPSQIGKDLKTVHSSIAHVTRVAQANVHVYRELVSFLATLMSATKGVTGNRLVQTYRTAYQNVSQAFKILPQNQTDQDTTLRHLQAIHAYYALPSSHRAMMVTAGSRSKKVLKWTGISLASLVGLALLAYGGYTAWTWEQAAPPVAPNAASTAGTNTTLTTPTGAHVGSQDDITSTSPTQPVSNSAPAATTSTTTHPASSPARSLKPKKSHGNSGGPATNLATLRSSTTPAHDSGGATGATLNPTTTPPASTHAATGGAIDPVKRANDAGFHDLTLNIIGDTGVTVSAVEQQKLLTYARGQEAIEKSERDNFYGCLVAHLFIKRAEINDVATTKRAFTQNKPIKFNAIDPEQLHGDAVDTAYRSLKGALKEASRNNSLAQKALTDRATRSFTDWQNLLAGSPVK